MRHSHSGRNSIKGREIKSSLGRTCLGGGLKRFEAAPPVLLSDQEQEQTQKKRGQPRRAGASLQQLGTTLSQAASSSES